MYVLFILYIYFIVSIIISLLFLHSVSLYVGFSWVLFLVYYRRIGMLCGTFCYAIMQILSKSQNKHTHYIHCAIGRPAEACAAYTSYCMRYAIDLLISALFCLADQYNSLSLERAREKYASDTYGLLVNIFSVNHLY